MAADRLKYPLRVLVADQAAGDERPGDVRDHGVAAACLEPVYLQGRALPEPLQGGVPVLAVRLRDAEIGREPVVVERHRVKLGPAVRAWRSHAVVEAGDGDRSVRGVQPGQDRRQRVHGVGDGAAVAAGVQVVAGALDGDGERGQALGGDRERRLVRPPLRPVSRDHQVAGELGCVLAHVRGQVRAADLLLAFDEELHVEREPAALRDRGPEHRHDQEDRSLVVGDAATAGDVAVDGQLERRGQPLGVVAGRLHVVVAVDENGGGAGGAEPFAADDRVAVGRLDPAGRRSRVGRRSSRPPVAWCRGRRCGCRSGSPRTR